jgi:hypothetical protein
MKPYSQSLHDVREGAIRLAQSLANSRLLMTLCAVGAAIEWTQGLGSRLSRGAARNELETRRTFAPVAVHLPVMQPRFVTA